MYRAVTDGKFGEALRQVNMILAIVPLTVVNTRHEVDELKEVISIARCARRPTTAHASHMHACCLCTPSVTGIEHVLCMLSASEVASSDLSASSPQKTYVWLY